MDDEWTSIDGSPSPLGASWVADAAAYNFALYAKHATAVSLILYGAQDFVTPLAKPPPSPPFKRPQAPHTAAKPATARDNPPPHALWLR